MWFSLFDNALLQGLSYGVAVLGVAVSFRVLRYPDLTPDGSFLLGGVCFGALLNAGASWQLAAVIALVAGILAGLCTAFLHVKAKVNRLLTGILTSMVCYSIGFRILSGRSNLSLDSTTMLSAATALDSKQQWLRGDVHPFSLLVLIVFAAALAGGVFILLRSEFGIVLRASGENRKLVEELGRVPSKYHTIGLGIANGLVSLAGCLVVARQGFVDVNMGIGMIIGLVASLVIGEDLVRLIGLRPSDNLFARVLAPIAGCCVYYLIYLFMLRASIRGWLPIKIQPTDLKLLSAVLVVAVIAVRAHSAKQRNASEEILPI